ncbi:hypothetical protein KOR34_35420 [Posidoniimonas corsicana]|uniref:Carbohydrate-selective porin, OprB family n=1 Tax=Posidoniimonas corsicana TaxID=1938618 RepID=A0A5C5V726_9BACT|nr:hypothetical protein [Posidoniimonas corsicana]TWT33709.1 hypothetical protein KOR34_35420 [Posidoniimonas corsicana]
MPISLARFVAAIAVLFAGSACLSRAGAEQPGAVEYQYGAPLASTASTAYPGNDFAAQLSAARGEACSGACDWGWGAGGSPFRTGPGRCDDFLVGPRWTSRLDAVFMFRENIDLDTLAAGATAGGVVIDPADAGTITENMREGIGARVMLSSYWPQCKGYEMQVGYLGIFNWQANAFNPDVPFAGPLPAPPGFESQKSLKYRSELHSVEVNGQTINDGPIKLFGGGRFVLLTERVSDLLDNTAQPPQIPPNFDGGIVGDPALDVTDILRGVSVDNHLLGIQSGMRADFFTLGNRFHVEGFLSGGAYFNYIKRESMYTETRTRLALDDPSTAVNEGQFSSNSSRTGYEEDRMRVAFIGEAMLGGVYQINRCATARLGYQALYLTGVELGNEAFVGAGPTNGDLLTHGWFGGVEYKR